MYDVIILGSGPAGLTAAIYCGRANKNTLVLAGSVLGGKTGEIAVLENYPGWSGSGMELIQFMQKQAESFGAKMKYAQCQNIITILYCDIPSNLCAVLSDYECRCRYTQSRQAELGQH